MYPPVDVSLIKEQYRELTVIMRRLSWRKVLGEPRGIFRWLTGLFGRRGWKVTGPGTPGNGEKPSTGGEEHV
jgi:hypothetical protein